MQYQMIVGKTNAYLHEASAGLAKWLDRYLPSGEDRWERFVLSKLSSDQRNYILQNHWSRLEELDLSALLRIADRNFHVISQKYFLGYTEKECIEKMFGVRNRWAHISCGTPIHVVQIISDLETLKSFYGQLETNAQIKHDIADFINQIKKEPITDEPVIVIAEKDIVEPNAKNLKELAIGDIVHLTSDPTKLGPITSVSNIGNTKQYDVIIDNTTRSFFANQVEPELSKPGEKNVDVSDLLTTLTSKLISVCL